MTERRKRSEDAGVGDENIEMLPALIERRAELVDPVAFFEIELQKRRCPAGSLYFVIERFERTERACRDYDVGPGFRKPQRHGPAYATRRARDECDASAQWAIRHTLYLIAIYLIGPIGDRQPTSARSESCRGMDSPL